MDPGRSGSGLLFDLRGDSVVAIILAVGFTPSDNAGIGFDADEHKILTPAGMNRKTLDADDLHCYSRYAMWLLELSAPFDEWQQEHADRQHETGDPERRRQEDFGIACR